MADSVDHPIRALQRSIMDSRRRPVGTLTPGMLLARELIGYLSRQMDARLSPSTFETGDPAATAEVISQIIEEDLSIEDRLYDDVRDLLDQYSDYMRREGVSYQDMFRKIKNQLVAQRKIIRASGRDTGDSMKLSRDKVNDLSHKIVTGLRKAREVRVRKDSNEVRLAFVREFTDLLQMEERVDRAARAKGDPREPPGQGAFGAP